MTDAATLERISQSARGKVLELDLARLGIPHVKSFPDVFSNSGGIPDLFFNGRRMNLSRFPNNGFMTIKRVTDTGGGPQGKNWRDPAADNRPSTGGGTFEYRDEFAAQFQRWHKSLDRGVWLKGYWRVMWDNPAIRVLSIDTAKQTITFAKPIPGGIGNKYHRPEGSGQEQYWALNLLEEIDQPGEWCLDFKDQKLYFFPPAPLAQAQILLADRDEPVVHLNGASHIVLANLLIEAALGEGIRIDGGHDDLVGGCIVREVDKNAVVLNGGTHNTVLSCDLYNLGAGGVWLGGGDEKTAPRIPADHQVLNNHIHHYSEIEHVYTAAVNCGFTGGGGGGHHPAVGMLVAHNLIHDTPHVGVLFGSWDNVFEYNEVFRYCTVSNDMGAFYSYDHVERMGNETFRFNFIHSTDDGDGIYFDHDHPDMHIFGNVVALRSTGKRGTGFLYKIGSQGKNPQFIECCNNVAVDCNVGFQFVSALPRQGKIENNITLNCKVPWGWRIVEDAMEVTAKQGYATGKNIAYDSDPGFVDAGHLNFRLKPGAQVLRDLPGFKPIPFEKIGLYVDEYRTTLPGDDEIDRLGKHVRHSGSGYEVEDRKYCAQRPPHERRSKDIQMKYTRSMTLVLLAGLGCGIALHGRQVEAANVSKELPPQPQPPYLTPEEEAKTFQLPEGYRMELVLSEPDIKEPVVCVFDGNGRMYVAEMRTYMQDIDGTNELDAGRPGFAPREHQGRRRLRQAHRLRRQPAAAAHGAAAGRPRADQRDQHQRHLRLPRHQGRRRGRQERAVLRRRPARRQPRAPAERPGLGPWTTGSTSPSTPSASAMTGKEVLKEKTPGNGGQWGLTQDDYGKMWFSNGGAEKGPSASRRRSSTAGSTLPDEAAPDFLEVWPLVGLADVQGGTQPLSGPRTKRSTTSPPPAARRSSAATGFRQTCAATS